MQSKMFSNVISHLNPSIKVRTILLIIAIIYITPISGNSQNIMKSKPFVIGETIEIFSKELSETRTLNIYLPDGYNEKDSTKYHVVYLLDGGADEDFIHVAGLYQFNNFSWIDRVPKSIVVGIVNRDRRRDFTFPSTIPEELKRYPTAGRSAKFMAFIERDLKPFINKAYKTNRAATLIGQSLGGLFAVEVLLKKPDLFDRYIIISPSLWWDDGSLLKIETNPADADKIKNLSVYVGVGKEGLGPSSIPHVMVVDANLLVEKLKKDKFNVYFDYLPNEDHATISHQAIFNALRILHPLSENK